MKLIHSYKFWLFCVVLIAICILTIYKSIKSPLRVIPYNAMYGNQFANTLNDTFMIQHFVTGKPDSLRLSFYLIEGSFNVDSNSIKNIVVNFLDTSKGVSRIFSKEIRSQISFYKTSHVTKRDFTPDEDNATPTEDEVAEVSYYDDDHIYLRVSPDIKNSFFYLIKINPLIEHKVIKTIQWRQ